MHKGITPIVAVVLLLMMTVAAGGVAYIFLSGLQSSGQEATSGQMGKIITSTSSCMNVESTYGAKIYLRNCGTGVISKDDLTAYVDNTKVDVIMMTPMIIEEGKTAKVFIDVPSGSSDNRNVKLSTSSGSTTTTTIKPIFSDDFNDGVIDTNKWEVVAGSWSELTGSVGGETSGYLQRKPGFTVDRNYVVSTKNNFDDTLIEVRYAGNDFISGDGDSDNDNGVVFRYRDINNFYAFHHDIGNLDTASCANGLQDDEIAIEKKVGGSELCVLHITGDGSLGVLSSEWINGL